MNGTQNVHFSGSKTAMSTGVHASNNRNSDVEDEEHPLRAPLI